MAENKFPTEMVELPSKGYFYFDGHPLSSGKVEVKYMTAKEEDILTSQNLIQQGLVIDRLLESLVVDKSIKLDDMLIGDKNAIMVAARILGYGKDYEFEYDGKKQQVDLSKLNPIEINYSNFEKGKNEFSYKLPTSERDITFKLLTGKDENLILKELKASTKLGSEVSPELTTRLRHTITSVEGDESQSVINNFVQNLLARDSMYLRKEIRKVTPDIELQQEIEIEGEPVKVDIPMTVGFFWPDSEG